MGSIANNIGENEMSTFTVTFTITTVSEVDPHNWISNTISDALEKGEDMFGMTVQSVDHVDYMGRRYNVCGVFSECNVDIANEFMLLNEGTSLLTVQNGLIYIVSSTDLGTEIHS